MKSKMKQNLFFAVLLLSISPVFAGSVEWGCFAVAQTGENTVGIGYTGNQVYANTSVHIQTTRSGAKLNIAEYNTFLASFSSWAVASAGEIIDGGLLRDTSRLFYRNDGTITSNPFDVNYGSDSFYFVFETLVWNNEEMSGTPQTEYGWVKINVAKGILSVADSAMGYGGLPMIAGGGTIPEPSTGLMLLTGLAALALKRKRTGDCVPKRPLLLR